MTKYISATALFLLTAAVAYADSSNGSGYYVSVPYSFPWIVMGIIFSFIALPLLIGMLTYIMYDKKQKAKKAGEKK